MPGAPAYQPVIDTFGTDIVAEDGTIDRRRLGSKVFGQPEGLATLNKLVWPVIQELAEQEIATQRERGRYTAQGWSS